MIFETVCFLRTYRFVTAYRKEHLIVTRSDMKFRSDNAADNRRTTYNVAACIVPEKRIVSKLCAAVCSGLNGQRNPSPPHSNPPGRCHRFIISTVVHKYKCVIRFHLGYCVYDSAKGVLS